VAKDAVRKFLAEMNRERGVTVILTTHDLMDIEQICPRLIMVDEGKLLYDGELKRLRAALGGKRRLRLEFEDNPGDVRLPKARLTSDEGTLKHYEIAEEGVSLLDVLADLPPSLAVKDVAVEEPSIEEVIRTFYAEKPKLAAMGEAR
jgi:ABC-2 type transport system ATP-binding protein